MRNFHWILAPLFLLLSADALTAQEQILVESIGTSCIHFSKVTVGSESDMEARDCKVTEFGKFGNLHGKDYFYAIYCLIPGYDQGNTHCGDGSYTAQIHADRALAVFTRSEGSKTAELLFEKTDTEFGTSYEKPEILPTHGNTLLILPIHGDGTAAINESNFFLDKDGKWIPIDNEEWLKTVRSKVPAKFEMLKGIWPDFAKMTAETGLYNKGDANCCPTGGTALIKLDLDRTQNKLVVKSVTIEPPKARATDR